MPWLNMSPGVVPASLGFGSALLVRASMVPAAAVQNMISHNSTETDASGNAILGDIGLYLGKSLKRHFKDVGRPIDLKYIDPTYMIRAIPTIPSDRVYCNVLGQNSVHAAFAGFSGARPSLATPAIVCRLVLAIGACVVHEKPLVSAPGLASTQLLFLDAKDSGWSRIACCATLAQCSAVVTKL
jgi:6-phosphofructokinase